MTMNANMDRAAPTWQVIEYIKRNGSATIKELETLLNVTTNAVRQHLQALQAEGYIERRQVNIGVGRPHHAYSITAKAHELFACHCDRLASRYASSVRGEMLQDRVEQLAGALSRRGVLTDINVEDENTIILHAYNCPYHELAQEHRSICEMDEDVMRKVLGSDVNLSACMMDGHNGCSFVVSNHVASNHVVANEPPLAA